MVLFSPCCRAGKPQEDLLDDATLHISAPFFTPTSSAVAQSIVEASLPIPPQPSFAEVSNAKMPFFEEEKEEGLSEEEEEEREEEEEEDMVSSAAPVATANSASEEKAPQLQTTQVPIKSHHPTAPSAQGGIKPRPAPFKPLASVVPKPAASSASATSVPAAATAAAKEGTLSLEERLLRAQQNRERLEEKRNQALLEKKTRLDEAEKRRKEKLEAIRLKRQAQQGGAPSTLPALTAASENKEQQGRKRAPETIVRSHLAPLFADPI